MNSSKKTLGGFFVVSFSISRSFGKAQNVQAICRIDQSIAMQSESTQLTPNLSLLPNLERRQTNFGTGNYFSVLEREKKKIEMDFVTFIGFLATSQVFKADGWFMVLQGGSRALWSY